MSRSTRRLLVVAAIALTASGCQSVQTGGEGLLQFSYVTDDDSFDFNKPIAVGAKLDVRVEEAGGAFSGVRPDPTITDASADNIAVLGIDGYEGNVVTLAGIAAGKSNLDVAATLQDGQMVEDFVNFRVAEVTEVQLNHTCGPLTEAKGFYIAGDQSEVWVPYELLATNGIGNQEPAIGYGLFPVDVEPAGALTLVEDTKNQQWFQFTGQPAAPGAVVLTSQVDGTTITMEYVDAGDVVSNQLVKFLSDGCIGDGEVDPCTLVGGNGTAFYMLPLLDDASPVCQSDLEFTIDVTTPEICEVSGTSNPDEVTEAGAGTTGQNESNWILVKGLAIGECAFSVTYPAGNAGMGATIEHTVTVKGGADDLP